MDDISVRMAALEAAVDVVAGSKDSELLNDRQVSLGFLLTVAKAVERWLLEGDGQ